MTIVESPFTSINTSEPPESMEQLPLGFLLLMVMPIPKLQAHVWHRTCPTTQQWCQHCFCPGKAAEKGRLIQGGSPNQQHQRLSGSFVQLGFTTDAPLQGETETHFLLVNSETFPHASNPTHRQAGAASQTIKSLVCFNYKIGIRLISSALE